MTNNSATSMALAGATVHAHGPVELALLCLPVAVLSAVTVVRLGAEQGIPTAMRLYRAYVSAGPGARVAALYLSISATVHLALVPAHLHAPVAALLFFLDGAALVAAVLCCFLVTWWRPAAVALLAGGIGAYLLFVVMRLDAVDAVGLLTKTVEVAALALIVVEKFVGARLASPSGGIVN